MSNEWQVTGYKLQDARCKSLVNGNFIE